MPILSILPIVLAVGLLLLLVAVNSFHKQAQTEELELLSLEIMKREKLQKLGTVRVSFD